MRPGFFLSGMLYGLRGLSALVVVISHFVQIFFPALLTLDQSVVHNEWELSIPNQPINLVYRETMVK